MADHAGTIKCVINRELRKPIQKYVHVTLILDNHVPYVFAAGIPDMPLKRKYVFQRLGNLGKGTQCQDSIQKRRRKEEDKENAPASVSLGPP